MLMIMNSCSVLAAKSLGDEVYNNFLDHTYLADRRTTIRQYFEKVGTNIMEEEPPESLKTRYGGWWDPLAHTVLDLPFLNLILLIISSYYYIIWIEDITRVTAANFECGSIRQIKKVAVTKPRKQFSRMKCINKLKGAHYCKCLVFVYYNSGSLHIRGTFCFCETCSTPVCVPLVLFDPYSICCLMMSSRLLLLWGLSPLVYPPIKEEVMIKYYIIHIRLYVYIKLLYDFVYLFGFGLSLEQCKSHIGGFIKLESWELTIKIPRAPW